MNLNDTLALIRAGYTKEEIQAMETTVEPAPAPVSEPEPSPVPEPKQTEPAPAPAAPEAQASEYQKLEALLNKFIGVAQQNNLNASMNESGVARTDTDILASVINPPRKDRVK